MKKITALCLCFVMVFSFIITVPAFAATSGTCGDGVNWSYDEGSKTLSITGSGAIENYKDVLSIPWKKYCREVQKVEIGEGVTEIGNYSLTWCANVTDFILPSTVTRIGRNAFAWNEELTSVTFPSNLKTIEKEAFIHCPKLSQVSIPASVTDISSDAFVWCYGLTSINVELDNQKYQSFDGVLFNKIANSIVTYPSGKSATSYTIPNNIIEIEDMAFRGNNTLLSVSMGEMKRIGIAAFTGSKTLYSVNMLGAAIIDDFAFYGCYTMANITIPSNTTYIGNSVFKNCDYLQIVTVMSENTQFGDSVFDGDDYLSIVGIEGSTANWYAHSQGITFNPLVSVLYGEKYYTFDPVAFIINDATTMVPMRGVFEMLDAIVTWDETTNTAIAVKDGITVSIQIGSSLLYRNGEAIMLPETGMLIADKTYVPLRAVTEAFDNTVDWRGETNTVVIY